MFYKNKDFPRIGVRKSIDGARTGSKALQERCFYMTCIDSALQPRPQNTPAAEQGARQRSSGCGTAGASGMVRKGPGLVLGKPGVGALLGGGLVLD